MSSNNATSNVVSVDEQAFEKADEAAVDEDGFEVVDETPKFRRRCRWRCRQRSMRTTRTGWSTPASDERIYGATLEQEERIRARG